VTFAFIAAEKAHFPIRVLCRALDVSPSGYYAAQCRPPSARAVADVGLVRRVQVLHAAHRRVYGRPRLQRALRHEGIRLGDRRLRRLMRAGDVRAHGRRRYRVTTDSRHDATVARNHLARAFAVPRLNQVWVGDLTALWTTEGWLYLAVLLDLASRRVVGWAAAATMDTTVALAALHQALQRRPVRRGLLHHSDRGGQYASARYQDTLRRQGIRVSMSRKGNCWDNSVAESFFSILKTELHPATWPTRAQARAAIADYIEGFYNCSRLHSTLGYQSPAAFEAQCKVARMIR
jgi:transposase InsO family protein